MRIRASAVYVTMLTAAAAPVQAAPLSDEISALISDNPRIEAARNNLKAAQKAIDEAFSDYLPKLDLSADAGHIYSDSSTRRQSGQDNYAAGRESATLTLTQKLWDGGAREAKFASAKLERDAASASLAATQQDVLLEAAVAYMNVLRQARLLDLSLQNERTIMEQLDLENERVQRGSGIAVDVLQAKSRLQVAKERRVAVQGALPGCAGSLRPDIRCACGHRLNGTAASAPRFDSNVIGRGNCHRSCGEPLC